MVSKSTLLVAATLVAATLVAAIVTACANTGKEETVYHPPGEQWEERWDEPCAPSTAPTSHSSDQPNGLGGFVHFEWQTICIEPGDVLTLKAEFLPDLSVVIRNHGFTVYPGIGGTWPDIDVEFVGSSPVPKYNPRFERFRGIQWMNYENGNIQVRYGIPQDEVVDGRDYKFVSVRREQ